MAAVGRTVLASGYRRRRRWRDWWLVVADGEADVCDVDPGYDVAVTVSASLRGLVRVWRGDQSWAVALRSGDVVLDGPHAVRRALPGWFTLSPFAAVPRPALSS